MNGAFGLRPCPSGAAGVLAVLLPSRQTLPPERAAGSFADRWLLALDAALDRFLGPIAYHLALPSRSVVSQTILFARVLPLSALLARWLLREPLPRGFAISLALIAAGLLLPQRASAATGGSMDDRVGLGWALLGLAAFSSAAASGRTIALFLFGPHHFLVLQLGWVEGVIGVSAVVLALGRDLCLRLAHRQGKVAMVSLWRSLSLPVAVLSAALLLHEPLSLPILSGLALVLAGAFWGSAPTQSDRPPRRYLP